MEEWELEKLSAAVDSREYNDVPTLINLTRNLDCFEFHVRTENEEDLDRFYTEEMCMLEIPKHLENYIDYEAYGWGISLDEDGRFIKGDYVARTGDGFPEYYNGRDGLPDEYRIFAYPEPKKSTKKTLKSHGKTISETVIAVRGRSHPANAGRQPTSN